MRDIIVTLIFGYAGFLALSRPHFGIALWTWIGLMNPHRLAFGFAYSLPFAMASAAITLIGIIRKRDELSFPKNSTTVIFITFISWTFLTTVFAIHQDLSFELFTRAIKTFFMIILALFAINKKHHVTLMIWIMVLSLGFYGTKGGLFTILTGGSYRVWGPPDSLVFGNNEMAVALLMITPLMYYLSTSLEKTWQKNCMLASMLLTVAAALGSQSRGALLAAAAISITLWFKSKQKLQLIIIILAFTPIILAFMPDTWWSRMDTIKTYDQDSSAMGRINAWHMALNIAIDRFTGAGFATATRHVYALYAPDSSGPPLVAHSVYFQVLGDHGFIGLILYLSLWVLTYKNASTIVKKTKKIESLHWARDLASMTQVGLTAFFVGGAFLSLAYWDGPYYLMVIIIALQGVVNREINEIQTNQNPLLRTNNIAKGIV